MNETKQGPRQKFIVNLVNESNGIGRAGIEQRVASLYPSSKPTIARDLASLAGDELIKVKGSGRSTLYFPVSTHPLLKHFELEPYFALDPDRRFVTQKTFDFSIFDHLKNLFSKKEVIEFEKINKP